MYELSALGLSPFFKEQLHEEDVILARIASENRGTYNILSSAGESLARLAGRLADKLDPEEIPVVGDWVTLKSPPCVDQTSIIESVLSRKTVFIRGAAGRQSRGQVIAANIDIVFCVCGLDADYNIRRIERYLARIWASGAQPVVILNKADVCDNVDERVSEVEGNSLGVPVLVTSAIQSIGTEQIFPYVSRGITAAFLGSSGAGKSTLINALLGEEVMATGETRPRDGRGCHTTTHRRLIPTPDGGLIIDTPGMRELQLFDEDGIGDVFSDIEKLSSRCRFKDCLHQSEPDCAVQKAIEEGLIQAERLDHYLKLKKEAQAYEQRHNEASRRKVDRAFSKMVKTDTKRIRNWKQGK